MSRSSLLVVLLGISLLTIALPTQAAPSAKMWDTVQTRDWELLVRSIERQSGIFPSLESGTDRVAVLVVDVTNRTNASRRISASDFSLMTTNGLRFVNLTDVALGQTYTVNRGLTPISASIEPGSTATTALLFVVPFDSGRFILRYVPSNTAIEIDECHCNLPSPVRTVG